MILIQKNWPTSFSICSICSSDCKFLFLYSLHISVLLVIDKLMKGGEEIFTTYVIPKKDRRF